MAEIQDTGELVIGVKYDVPPFGFLNPQSGDVEGFDVDLGNAIAEELGVEAKPIEAISDNRIPFLEDGTVDLILSTMTITEERDLEIDFSEPYFIARGRVLVPKGSDIGGIEDLGAGDRVCTALGSTYAETLKAEAPEAELRLVDDYSACLELLQTDAVDAVSTDDVILTGMILQDDSLEMVGDPFTTEPYGIGIPEGRQATEGLRGRSPGHLQGGRPLGRGLPEVGRPVHGRRPATADDDAGRGDRAGTAGVAARHVSSREELSR